MSQVISLYDNVYAVRFPYHMVTEMTLERAIPHSFRRDIQSQRIRFAVESASEAGTKRADSEQIRKCFPAEIALLESQVESLKDYVLFRLEEAV